MAKTENANLAEHRRVLKYENGKVYFSAKAERKLFFVLTLAMLLYGALAKLGIV
ncbi:MAG: hypothetical protein JSV31_03070 [Desulfobacterales bacterium]|jgi:hypothetical protein|nr:MAG: hypothetical protein JSV31_03070 [Desulfobacterales bacterium]